MIALVSDSHVPNRAPEIPPEITERLNNAEKVVHAGDFASEETYQELDSGYSLTAVKGNCDFFDLPVSRTFEVSGIKFGVYHGTGISPRGDHETLVDIAKNKLEVDVLIHGHTHQEEAVEVEGIVLLNPGSCTGVGGGSARRSDATMMEIDVHGYELHTKLLTLDKGFEVEEKTFEIP
ncbi:MAG: YfcE family phosphodiesterase [Candidatus Nanohaloarchaea archaeon]